ncbi:outer membrane beta-barrel protein [Carboxylicivirga marina]|uniref:outer membrane beta-barrel protein n=1 Tax=Carboxylicivirga marina TaxID=2800988 RepID=UPI002595E5D9|nr:outer membrane beta-barrel protein [uncultured Carboxylicivirga sp.]
MKSILLSIILLLSINFLVKASDSEIKWGIKGGLNFGFFNSDIGPWKDVNALYLTGNTVPFDISVRMGIGGGLVMNYTFNDAFGLYTELLYSPKGSTYQRDNLNVVQVSQSGANTPTKDIVKYALDYVELPLGISISPHRRFNFKIGLAPAVNVSSRIKSNYWKEDKNNDLVNEPPFNNVPGTAVKEDYEKIKFDYAKNVICSASFEINYNISDGYCFLNFTKSLGEVYDISEMNGYNMKTQNTVISVGLTYLFSY